MKAFLSHSSLDKGFVDGVANRLGRSFIAYDKYCFKTGNSFITAIRQSLEGANVFVLFASQESLASFWVNFEMDEAEELLLRKKVLQKSLTLIIDPLLKLTDLPEWMRRPKVEVVRSSFRASQIIETHFNNLRGITEQPLFIGREALLEEFAKNVIPPPNKSKLSIIAVGGLVGVGRKTFLKKALKNTLSLDYGPEINLEATDGLDKLYVLLLELLGEVDPRTAIGIFDKCFSSNFKPAKRDLLLKAVFFAGISIFRANISFDQSR